MPRVSFLHPQGRSGEVESNLTLLEAAKTLGFELNHDCGGNASCTTCRVEVQMGGDNLSEIDFDEQDLLDLLGMSLKVHGYSVLTARNGAEALAVVAGQRPDLILLDILLGDVSGIDLAARLKHSPETQAIPIILLTAKDTETDAGASPSRSGIVRPTTFGDS